MGISYLLLSFLLVVIVEQDNAQLGACPEGIQCINGLCNEDGLCQCWDGWAGEQCDVDLEQDEVKSRRKRSLPTTATVTEIEFYLNKETPFENVTDIYPGSRIHFSLTIHLPPYTDLLVELFTPDNDTTVMALCDVNITWCGSNIIQCPQVMAMEPQLASKEPGDTQYDQAILNFGMLNNTEADTSSYKPSSIVIEWDAVMVLNADTVDGAEYWISAGAEYDSESMIWVGQTSVTAHTSTKPGVDDPTFSISGSDTVEIGSSEMYTIDMNLTFGAEILTFDALSPLTGNGELYIGSAIIKYAGKDYDCLNQLMDGHILPESYDAETYDGYDRVRLNIGTVINKGAYDDYNEQPGDNMIQIEFLVCATDNISAIDTSREIGAALEIGTSQIWAGTFNVTVKDKVNLSADLPSPPALNLTANPNTLSVLSPVQIEFEADIPEQTNSDFTIEFSMPYASGQARLSVCSAVVTFLGKNMPCKKSAIEPVFTSQTSGSTEYDKVFMDLGRIRNVGVYNASADPDVNKLRVMALATATDHPDNAAGQSADVTVTFTYGSQTSTETVTVDFSDTATALPMAKDQYPDWEMNFTMGDGSVPVGGWTVAEITMTTKPLVYYWNLDTEVMVPIVDGDYLYQICSVELVHVGSNLGCVDLEAITESIVPHSNFSDDIYDRFTLQLGGVFNKRQPTGVLVDPDDDVIRLRTVVRVRDHPANVDGYQNWLSAGFRFHPLKLWVGQLQITSMATPDPIDPNDLYINITRGDDVIGDDLFIGKSLRYIVVMKMQAMTQGPAIFKVSVVGVTDLKICALYLVSAGPNLGCDYDTNITATYSLRAGTDDEYESAELDLGIIANIGVNNITENGTVDDSSLVLEFVVHLSSAATSGDVLTVDVGVDSGSNTDIVAGLDQTITARTDEPSTNTPSTSLPTYELLQAPIANETTNDTIIPGESKKFYFDIYFAEYSTNAYNIKFLSPVNYTGALEICGAAVVSVGRNLPCLNRKMYMDTASYTKRYESDYDDIGTLDLGYVCQFPVVNDTEENKIRLEVVIRAPRHLPLLPLRPPDGQLIWMSATAKINADQIYVSQRSLTVQYDNSTFQPIYSDVSRPNVTFEDSSPLALRPAEVDTVRLEVYVPPKTAQIAKLQVLTELSTSAVMTINKISVVPDSAGANLGCYTAFTDLDFFPDYISERQTSQFTNATLNLGIITNSGITLTDERHVSPDDDRFYIDIELQMADSLINVANYTTNLTVALTMGRWLEIATKGISIMRNNTEAPHLVLSANITNENVTYNESFSVTVEAQLRHSDISSAEAHNVSVVFYYPQYLSFSRIDQVNMTETSNEPVARQLPNNKGVVFFFDHVYFTDDIYWTFELDVVPVDLTEVVSVYEATTPYEAYSNMIHRKDNVQPEGYFYATPLDYLTYMVQPTVSIGDNIVVLGMASGVIQDCQLEASVESDPAVNARPTGPGWKAANRGPIYQPYLQVNFGNVTRVTEIILSEPTGFTPDVAVGDLKYDVYTSNDYFVWTHIELMTGSGVLAAPAIGRHFRMAINKKGLPEDAEVGFTVELKGYYISNDVLPADVCKTPDVWQVVTPPTEMYYRGFVAHGTDMFFCDLVAPGKQNVYEEEVECYRTSDGQTWQVLDKSVFNVIGYDAANNLLYGLCKDKKSYLVSDDMGTTWYATSKQQFDAAAKVVPKTVPFTKTSTFDASLTEPDASFRDDTGMIAGAHFKGMFYYSGSWTQATDWSSCCLA